MTRKPWGETGSPTWVPSSPPRTRSSAAERQRWPPALRPEAILAARVGLKRAVSSAIVLTARGGPGRRRRWLPTTCKCRLMQQKKKKKKKRKGREVRNSTCPSPTSMVSQSRLY